MKYITLIAIVFCLFGCTDSYRAAEKVEGWGHYADQKRDFMRDAMRQNKAEVTLIEYRWLMKPTGRFGKEITEEYAIQSIGDREARKLNTKNQYPFRAQFENREWWLALRVIIAVNRTDPLHDTLISPAALEALTTPMGLLFDTFPTDDHRKMRKWSLIRGDLREEPAMPFQNTLINWQRDQFVGSMGGGFPLVFFPTVHDWYTRLGAPYVKAPHVVQSVWFWHDYIDHTQIESYVENTRKEFAEVNASYPSPIKILDVRVPVK